MMLIEKPRQRLQSRGLRLSKDQDTLKKVTVSSC